ncbi:hypothetical protein [Clostridium sp.]|uniref:hypothetical protein n=1 Tax=Clostridium sp. TaxID=1506 RepID=UPI00262035B1|nr:hypothetical protein [Clostridium sp.]
MGAPDPTNKLYRTNWELGQIKQAMISQTQYNLNMGNDFSTGSESFSIGGVNGSFQRPLERQVIAPAVYKLLQNARVYKLNSYGMSFSNSEEEIQEECDFITREVADKRYLAQYQPNVKKGNVAYVNNSNMIDFGDPQDLNITTYNTINIKDPQTNEYVPLNKVLDILFRGKDLYGPYSGVERGELLNIVSLVNMN